VLGSAPHAHGIPETDYVQIFMSKIVPTINQIPTQTFIGVGGVSVAYRIIPANAASPARGNIVFLHGYSESMLKNAEVIFDLSQAGYKVFAMDLRGMGESQHLLRNTQVGYVEKFSDYVDDLEYFVHKIVLPQAHGNVYILAHSLGGMVSAAWLARGPTPIKAVAMSAPMFSINTRSYPEWLASALVHFNTWRGAGQEYIPGAGDYNPQEEEVPESSSTHSLPRFHGTVAVNRTFPKLRIWGQSNQWLAASFDATHSVAAIAPKVTIPVRIYQATEDSVVTPDGQKRFCQLAPQCELRIVAGGRHEILQERDDIRSPVMADIIGFFHE
jgi:lysophospholipase